MYEPHPDMWPHQKRMLASISPSRRFCAARYGGGKTWITIEVARQELARRKECELHAVIFCKERNIPTWRAEYRKRNRDVSCLSHKEGLDLLENGLFFHRDKVLLFPHHYLSHKSDLLLQHLPRWKPAVVAIDESTCIKNPKTIAAGTAHKLARKLPEATIRLALAGRPAPEGPYELWSQYEWVYAGANPLGKTYWNFLRDWFIKGDYSKYALNLSKQAEFYEIVNRHALYILPSEMKALEAAMGITKPVSITEFYTPSEEQTLALNYLFENWELPTHMFADTSPSAAEDGDPFTTEEEELNLSDVDLPEAKANEYRHSIVVLGKANQICSGFYYDDEGQVTQLASNPKLDATIDVIQQLLEENPLRQIILWYRYIAEESIIYSALENAQITAVCGPTAEALEEFSNPAVPLEHRPRVILMPLSTTQGFNELSGADTAIWFSNLHSQETRDQAESRNSGLRQKFPVIQHIDMAGIGLPDYDVIVALQGKSLSPLKLVSIVNKYHKKGS